jgi:hypothetical protein
LDLVCCCLLFALREMKNKLDATVLVARRAIIFIMVDAFFFSFSYFPIFSIRRIVAAAAADARHIESGIFLSLFYS